ncbi:MAG: BadM/Rrf2 family transcriptional regulator [Puniceicoccaceae bacterium 5H]|nr:MAG: BadM/Rrf2 family transcriptional regulator [Puniceicoccaceae bacterium 5H]
MQLSKKAEYGLRALINLGIAQECGRAHVSAAELAQADNLPLKFLEQILLQLRSADFVDTRRGKGGGYYVAQPLAAIKMGDLVRLLDGPLAPIGCASKSAYARCSCPDETHCGLRMLMIDVRNAIANILDRYSLGDVVEVTMRKIRRQGGEHYFLTCQNEPEPPAPDNPTDPALGFLAELTRDA